MLARTPGNLNPVRCTQDRFRSNMARIPNGDRVVAFKGPSLQSLAHLLTSGLDSRFDAVFIDGSHEVMCDMRKEHVG